MKSYPKIPYFNQGIFGQTVWAFDKLDGSNIRCEWNRKRGWYKFGTRNNMIDQNNPQFGEAITIFLDKYGEDLTRVFKKSYSNVESIVVFGEYFGENSFAGLHFDEPKDVVIFDVNLYKRGLIGPREFIQNFGDLEIPKLIYKGEYNTDLIERIRNNHFDLKEGVICKGVHRDEVWMTKIKTKEWLERVKNKLGEKALLEELNNDKRLLDYGN